MTRRFPMHGWLGLGLVAVIWPLNWTLDGLRTQWLFFPLWLGYCLVVDGLSVRRSGTSLLTRSPRRYAGLFLISVPLWWLFEAINLRTQNWHYLGRELIGDVEYGLLASLSFSTVVPAVLGTAECVAGTSLLRRFRSGPEMRARRTAALLPAVGLVALALVMIWPRVFYPLVWLALALLIDPLNLRLGNQSLLACTGRGEWRPVAALSIGVLICGFFWEMWNFYSYPKWVYTTPGFDFWYAFEMPLPGEMNMLQAMRGCENSARV